MRAMWVPCSSWGGRVKWIPSSSRRAYRVTEVLDREAEFDIPGGIFVRGRVKRESRVSGREFAPEGRRELYLEPELVAVESDRGIHVGNEFDGVAELHCAPPLQHSHNSRSLIAVCRQ
jgi:hypothetical protein